MKTSSTEAVEAKVVFSVPWIWDVTGSLAVPPYRVALHLTRFRSPEMSSDITHHCGVGMSFPHWPETTNTRQLPVSTSTIFFKAQELMGGS